MHKKADAEKAVIVSQLAVQGYALVMAGIFLVVQG